MKTIDFDSAAGVDITVKQTSLAAQSVLQQPHLRRVLVRDGLAIAMFFVLASTAFHRVGSTSLDRVLLNGYIPRNGSLTFRVASWVTLLGSPGVVIVLGFGVAALAWFRYGSRAWGLACLAAPGIAGVGESTLKFLIARPRPLTAALTGEDGNGFPSGHAAGFCAFSCIVAFVLSNSLPINQPQQTGRRTLWAALALASTTVMALTRVLVGAHYPIDVIAGVLVGFVAADLVALLARSLDTTALSAGATN